MVFHFHHLNRVASMPADVPMVFCSGSVVRVHAFVCACACVTRAHERVCVSALTMPLYHRGPLQLQMHHLPFGSGITKAGRGEVASSHHLPHSRS